MKILISERLSPHKMKTPEGYLICTDAVLARTGPQTYRRNEVFGADCKDAESEISIDRKPEEVFSKATIASFENKPLTFTHPSENVTVDNHKEYSVGYVRDVRQGKNDDGQDVLLGTLVFTDKDAIEAIESGEYTDLSCGYDCDIIDEDNPQQRNIRGNHVALCEEGRAGIAHIVDSIEDEESFFEFYKRMRAEGFDISFEPDWRKHPKYGQIVDWNRRLQRIERSKFSKEDKERLKRVNTEGKNIEELARRSRQEFGDSVEDSEEDDWNYGYKDRMAGVYDKWYRYNRKDGGRAYDRGQMTASKQKDAPDTVRFIEVIHDMATMTFNFSTNIAAFERAIINNDESEFKSMQSIFEKDIADYTRWKKEGKLSSADIGKVKRQIDKINSLLAKSKINKKFEVKDMAILMDGNFKKESKQGYLVVSLWKDGGRTHAILERRSGDFVVAYGYDVNTGEWAQGRYVNSSSAAIDTMQEEKPNAVPMRDSKENEIIEDASRQDIISKLQSISVPYEGRYQTELGSGWSVDIQHHGRARYENVDKYPHVSPKEESLATLRLWYEGKFMQKFEGPINKVKSDAIAYLKGQTMDSVKDDDMHNAKQYAKRLAQKGELTSDIVKKMKAAFPSISAKDLQSALENATGIRLALSEFTDSLKTFKIEEVKDGVTYIRKIKATSVEDAIKKLSDDRLSPSTYRKLKELGVTQAQWSKMTQEQANQFIANRTKKAEGQKGKKSEETESKPQKMATVRLRNVSEQQGFGNKIAEQLKKGVDFDYTDDWRIVNIYTPKALEMVNRYRLDVTKESQRKGNEKEIFTKEQIDKANNLYNKMDYVYDTDVENIIKSLGISTDYNKGGVEVGEEDRDKVYVMSKNKDVLSNAAKYFKSKGHRIKIKTEEDFSGNTAYTFILK